MKDDTQVNLIVVLAIVLGLGFPAFLTQRCTSLSHRCLDLGGDTDGKGSCDLPPKAKGPK